MLISSPCILTAKAIGSYQPTLILHGGAGNIRRSSLPPALYDQYHASLLKYLTSTKELLDNGADAVEAACHAVSLFEDDPLFNCGRGSVFTSDGTIEMEASLMVTSLADFSTSNKSHSLGDSKRGSTQQSKLVGRTKKCSAVSMLTRTRHPILLAKEVLAMADHDEKTMDPSDRDGHNSDSELHSEEFAITVQSDVGQMHEHLSGQWVEDWGIREKGLEQKPFEWFWTRKRWEEHRKGLNLDTSDRAWQQKLGREPGDCEDGETAWYFDEFHDNDTLAAFAEVPSQGTVGAVCIDSFGNLCTATSTGGLTNKRSGRIGDTPSVGSGFWAESWVESAFKENLPTVTIETFPLIDHMKRAAMEGARFWAGDCFPSSLFHDQGNDSEPYQMAGVTSDGRKHGQLPYHKIENMDTSGGLAARKNHGLRLRAVAMSGTGNGDSFLRVNATRTAASMSRFSSTSSCSAHPLSLQEGVTAMAGAGGELERSAGDRWGRTGEGEGGIIGIEATKAIPVDGHDLMSTADFEAHVVFDFNCSGMWRAYYETAQNGELKPRIMVFKEEYR